MTVVNSQRCPGQNDWQSNSKVLASGKLDTARARLFMSDSTESVTIYHNPGLRKLPHHMSLIRSAGIEPTIIEYAKFPQSRRTLQRAAVQ